MMSNFLMGIILRIFTFLIWSPPPTFEIIIRGERNSISHHTLLKSAGLIIYMDLRIHNMYPIFIYKMYEPNYTRLPYYSRKELVQFFIYMCHIYRDDLVTYKFLNSI